MTGCGAVLKVLAERVERDYESAGAHLALADALAVDGQLTEASFHYLNVVNLMPDAIHAVSARVRSLGLAWSEEHTKEFCGLHGRLAKTFARAGQRDRAHVHRRIALFQSAFRREYHSIDRSDRALAIKRFHIHQYYDMTWMKSFWMGVPIQKAPSDPQNYQEVIYSHRPNVIIETGTYLGGSALYFAHLFDLIGEGRVITIDDRTEVGRPEHSRITYLKADSLHERTPVLVRALLPQNARPMVVLGSVHESQHVLSEMRVCSHFVLPGGFMVVEDTNVGGCPVWWSLGAGPSVAIEEFMRERDDFEIDHGPDKHLYAFARGGFLKRTR